MRGDGERERERERETKKDMAAVAARGLGARASARGTSASHAPLGVRGRPATRTAARKPAWEGQVRGLKTVASAGPVIQPTIQVGEDTVSTSRSGARHDLLSGWLRLTFLLAFPISLWRGSKTPPHQKKHEKSLVPQTDMMTYLLQNRILFVSGYLNDDVSRTPPSPHLANRIASRND